MKNFLIAFLALILSGTIMEGQEMDTMSYSLGVMVAQNIKKQGITDINAEKFAKAITDVLNDGELEIDVATADKILSTYAQKQKEKKHAGNKKAGEDFLATNKSAAGVMTTESGLQYMVMSEGTGAKPKIQDKVKVHYHGTLTTGEEFDSSVTRGEPISFPVNGVIQGWQEGLQLMSVGSKYKFFIPYHLAYGERAAGALIQPFSALVFEVELLGIE